IAHTHAISRHVPDALGMRAVAVGRQRVGRAVATASFADVADERAGTYHILMGASRAEEGGLRLVEGKRNREIVLLRADAPNPPVELERERRRSDGHLVR